MKGLLKNHQYAPSYCSTSAPSHWRRTQRTHTHSMLPANAWTAINEQLPCWLLKREKPWQMRPKQQAGKPRKPSPGWFAVFMNEVLPLWMTFLAAGIPAAMAPLSEHGLSKNSAYHLEDRRNNILFLEGGFTIYFCYVIGRNGFTRDHWLTTLPGLNTLLAWDKMRLPTVFYTNRAGHPGWSWRPVWACPCHSLALALSKRRTVLLSACHTHKQSTIWPDWSAHLSWLYVKRPKKELQKLQKTAEMAFFSFVWLYKLHEGKLQKLKHFSKKAHKYSLARGDLSVQVKSLLHSTPCPINLLYLQHKKTTLYNNK